MTIAFMSGMAALTITVAIATNKLPDPQAWMSAVFFIAAGGVALLAGSMAR